jgi:ribulose-phosphate 3-epimerase
MKIIPAILSNNPTEVKDLLYRCQDAGVDKVQVDIIDGVFADNKTVDPMVLEHIDTTVRYDIQLMTKEPINWVERCIRAGADRIIGHVEMMADQQEFVKKVTEFGLEVGLAIDLKTPVSAIDPLVINDLDVVLVMSVPAGYGGQEFDMSVMDKFSELNKLRSKDQTPFLICDDGGVTIQTAHDMAQLGVDEVAVGKRLFDGDLSTNIIKFQNAVHGRSST